MEPPPLPTQTGRFRLRVQILLPLDACNLNAVPLRQFTIVKTSALALPDLTLQQLCDEVVKRFKAIYPGESLFAVEKPQDSYGSDLYLGDCVRDIFEDNEIFRVIKGATIRASVEPHRARSESIRPPVFFPYGSATSEKRSHGFSGVEDSSRGHKRQRIISNDPDQPVRSRERDTEDREVEPRREPVETVLVQNSQETTVQNSMGQGDNVTSHGSRKYRQSTLAQNLDDVSVDLQYPNGNSKHPAPLERNQPPANDVGESVASSGSEYEPPRRGFKSRTKRKLLLTEDFSEQDRGQSTSTAITTPLSVVQQLSHQSSADDSRKLRRPSIRPARNNSENQQGSRLPTRKNIYEDIETDSEHHDLKPVSQDIPSTLIDSYKWRKSKLAARQGSNKSSSPLRGDSSISDKNTRTPVGKELDREQTLELAQARSIKLAKRLFGDERSGLSFEAEKQFLEDQDGEKGLQTRQEIELLAVESSRQLLEARKSTEVGTRKQMAASTKPTAVKEAQIQEKHVSNPKTKDSRLLQTRETSVVDSATARLEEDAVRKARENNELKEHPVSRTKPEYKSDLRNLQALQATVRRAAIAAGKVLTAGTDRSTGKVEPQAPVSTLPSISKPAVTMNTQATCTPFIPRGRPLRPSLTALHPSKASEGSSAVASSPSVGLEDQIPLPSQLKRKVSFLDQEPPSARRSSSASSSLKQTTLIPPRLGITDRKITPKRTVFMGKSNELKSSKGKAKVVESPPKPPTPIIEISSDEESIRKRDRTRAQYKSLNAEGSPGPASRKDGIMHPSSPPKSWTIEVGAVNPPVQSRPSLNGKVKRATTGKSKSPAEESRSSLAPDLRRRSALLSPEEPLAHAQSTSPRKLHSENNPPKLQRTTSTQSYDIPKATEISRQSSSQNTDENIPNDDEVEHESELAETHDNPTSDVSGSASDEDDSSSRGQEDERAPPDNERDEESAGSEEHEASQPANVTVPSKSGQQERKHSNVNGNHTRSDSPEEGSDTDGTDSENNRPDGEIEERFEAMQAQIDDQLMSQSFEATSSFIRQSKVPKPPSRSTSALTGNSLQQNQVAGRPSLKRMNQEAQRDKLTRTSSEAQRTRRPNAVKTAELQNEEDENSSSEFGSTSSEDEEEDGDVDANEKPSTVPYFKERDRMSRPAPNHQQQGKPNGENKSQRIGWAKLGKQFSVQKR